LNNAKYFPEKEVLSMRNEKIVIVVVLAIIALMLGTTAFAGGEWLRAGKEDKVELNENLTDSEKLYDMLIRTGGLDEYKDMLLKTKKEKLDTLVKIGKKTQKEADVRFEAFKAEVEYWNGTTDIIQKWFEKTRY